MKLTETSIHFESSRRFGSGERVQLRFDPGIVIKSSDDEAVTTGEGGVGLFPGMIIGIKGRNAGGGYFNVSEILLVRTYPVFIYVFEEQGADGNNRCRQWISPNLHSKSFWTINTGKASWTVNP